MTADRRLFTDTDVGPDARDLRAIGPGGVTWKTAGGSGRTRGATNSFVVLDRRSRRRLGAAIRTTLLAGVLGLASCSDAPRGMLGVVPTVEETARVDMLVATNRAPSPDAGILFTGERGEALRAIRLDVSIPPPGRRTAGRIQWPRRLPPDPATDFAVLSATPLDGKDGVRQFLKPERPVRRHVLVFVHGYNNDFDEAVFRFAQIVHDSGAEVVPVLFSWPSRGNPLDYAYDRESTNISRSDLEGVLRLVAHDPSVAEVTVMAHSMGCWLVVEALRQMAIRDGKVATRIRNVILAAPDIDVQVFRDQWLEQGSERPELTLIVSRSDRALDASRLIGGDVARLGQIDPTADPYRSELEKAGATVVDLTDVTGPDPLQHVTFAERPEIVRLLGWRMAEATRGGGPVTKGLRVIGTHGLLPRTLAIRTVQR